MKYLMVLFLCSWSVLAQTIDFDALKRHVVMIDGDTQGAGIIVGLANERIYIATANHVVRDYKTDEVFESLFARFFDLKGELIPLQVLIDFNQDRDLAVLSVNANLIPQSIVSSIMPLSVGDTDSLIFGDRVFNIGYQDATVWKMPGSGEYLNKDIDNLILSSGTIKPGSSGGGLFNQQGQLLGIVLDTKVNVLRIDVVIEFLNQWGYPVNFLGDGSVSEPLGSEPLSQPSPIPDSQTITQGYPCEAKVLVQTSVATMLNEVREGPDITSALTVAVREGSGVTIVEEVRSGGTTWYKFCMD
jgi:hypothetical protein